MLPVLLAILLRGALSTAGNSMTTAQALSGTTSDKRGVPAVLRGREFWKCFGGFKLLEYIGRGGAAVLSREFQEKN